MRQPNDRTDSNGLSKGSTLSRRKAFVFRFILLLAPLFFFAGIEGALRIFNYGDDLEIVKTKTIGQHEFYVINRALAKRYFGQSGTTIPEPSEDLFEKQKSPQTIRVFCLGESTMAGFPYDFNATAPSFLRDRLQSIFPDRNIEVINLGLSASTSFIVVDLVKQLVEYEPDLFVLYLGHNEFYGIFGSGSAVRIPGGTWLTNLHIALLHYRTYYLLREGLTALINLFTAPQSTPEGTMMEQMVREQVIPYGSELYVKTRETFRSNLKKIFEVSQRHGIPLVASALVSNIKDHPPFRSEFQTSTTPETRWEWERAFAQGEAAISKGDTSGAQRAFTRCTELDSLHARPFYLLGRIEYQRGNLVHAKNLLLRAKDLDALRFRASEDFAADLKRIATEHRVLVAPVDSFFASASTKGMIGNELMLEHLHPNIEGYFLLAKAIAQTILENRVLGSTGQNFHSDDEYWSRSRVTEFDRLVGQMKIDLLTHQWPFVTPTQPYRIRPRNRIEELALQYVEGKIFWSTARYELAEYYASRQEFELARKECLAISKVIPFSYQPLLMVADFYRFEGRTVEAKTWYARSMSVEDNPYARLKLAIILLEEERPADAKHQIQLAFDVAARNNFSLTKEAFASSYYLLGVAQAKMGEFSEATKSLQRSLSYEPHQNDAKELLQQLSSLQSRAPR